MKPHQYLYIVLLNLTFVFSACNNDDNIKSDEPGSIILHFDNVAGDKDLELVNGAYVNSSGESFSVTTLKYYVSNIKLKAGIKEFVVPQDESYFLIDESDEQSLDIQLDNIPADDYNEITFTVGIDSLKSVSDVGQRTGVLDPTSSDMYWAWNSGYIFFKMEGTSSVGMDDNFYYHIGGYGGYSADSKTINNVKEVTLSFGGDKATVRKNIEPEAHFYVDILKVFDGENQLSIEQNPMVMFSEYSVNIADNYDNMFEYGHVHNEPND
jgi:hypothetical protein